MLDFNTCETVENICGDLATTHTHTQREKIFYTKQLESDLSKTG